MKLQLWNKIFDALIQTPPPVIDPLVALFWKLQPTKIASALSIVIAAPMKLLLERPLLKLIPWKVVGFCEFVKRKRSVALPPLSATAAPGAARIVKAPVEL